MEIESILFVTNQHLLIKFKSGKTIVFLINGIVVPQKEAIQRYFDTSPIVSQSFVNNGRKTILLRKRHSSQDYFRNQYICIQFQENGLASIIGKFDAPIATARDLLDSRLEMRQRGMKIDINNLGKNLLTSALRQSSVFGKDYHPRTQKSQVKFVDDFFVTARN